MNAFIDEVAQRFPNISYLSLLRNPVSQEVLEDEAGNMSSNIAEEDSYFNFSSYLWPENSLTGYETVVRHSKYRLYIISKLQSLKILDNDAVTIEVYRLRVMSKLSIFNIISHINSAIFSYKRK